MKSTGIAFFAVVAVLALPFLAVMWIVHGLTSAWHRTLLGLKWPAGKFVLLAYSESDVWAPYIRERLIPEIGDHCVSINRSREDWKRRYPAEGRALEFWGGLFDYNPIAIVLRPFGRLKVFRLYPAFLDAKHGKPEALESQVASLVQCVKETAGPGS